MSQARITLRPPPNVEFIRGYPGIPAGHDRPHAEVTGTIELRLGASGVKAKWVQVELRKVETLPGGGQANTFYDYIGPSPVKVWGSNEEWGLLHTQDFPFSIRIPESVPPSIALEKNAGIKYELVAKVCMKGKKGIFRKTASPTLSTMTPIVLDKHELHSTWPVYSQPDSRHVVEDRLTLTVDRTHTCYGPGDRIAVNATFRNDAITVIDLRAFEFVLKETVIFRAGPHSQNKKGGPQVKVTAIGEQKVPMNRTVYGGQHHRAELSCVVPQSHNTTTVNAARHIDITYSLVVKAVLGSGRPLLMELPVTISNWPRHMSMEAVRRIGPSAGLSLLPPNAAMSVQRIQSIPGGQRPDVPDANNNAIPGRPNQVPNNVRPFSIAERVGSQGGGPPVDTVTSTQGYASGVNAGGRRPAYDEFGLPMNMDGQRPAPATYAGHNRQGSYSTTPANGMLDMRRPRPVDTAPAKRLTLVNADGDMEPDSPPAQTPRKYMTAAEEKRELQNASNRANSSRPKADSLTNGSALASQTEAKPASPPRKAPWASAEEEKARLYNRARSDAEQTQASLGNYSYVQKLQQKEPAGPEVIVVAPQPKRVETPRMYSPPPSEPEPAPVPAPLSSSPRRAAQWPSAEEEKLRLFNNAQNAAMRTQALAAGQLSPQQYPVGGSSSKADPYFVSPSADPRAPSSPGAALYSYAMASVSRGNSGQAVQQQSDDDRPTSPPYQSPPRQEVALPSPPKSRFPTAEEEKAALRYYEAKRKVDRHQNVGHHKSSSMTSNEGPSEDPIAYDALYPNQPSSSQSNALHNPYDAYEGAGSSSLSNAAPEIPSYQPPPPSPPPVAGSSSSMFNSAMAEKEKLRRRYEMEDAVANAGSSSASGPSSSSPPGYVGSPPPSGRSQPLPPVSPSASRQLSAAEEKARLRAQYEAEDAASRPNAAGGSSSTPAYSPPTEFSYFAGGSSAPPNGLSRATSMTYASNNSAIPPPPPLAPRPPAHYIEETEQEDARSQAEDHVMTTLDGMISQTSAGGSDAKVDFGLSFRPFSPLDLGSNFGPGQKGGHHVPAPPLPPKVHVFE